MADDHQLTRPGRAPLDAAPQPRRASSIPDDPEIARAEIEATRARMSETIDEIEDALLRKKEMIKEKLDVLAPVREQPLKTIGIIFGVGLALGLLTGGGDDEDDYRKALASLARDREDEEDPREEEYEEDEDEDEDDDGEAEAWAAAELWEDRAHRLLRIARAQEAELEVQRARRASRTRYRAELEDEEDEEDEDREDGGENLFDRIRGEAAERLSGFISEITQRMMRGT